MIPMPMTNQDMLPANDLGDRTPREGTKEISALETDSALQDAHEGIPALEIYNDLPDASLHEWHVAMVPLKDIYVGSDPQDEDLVTALADSSAISVFNILFVW
jgi:hypothetical protein